MCSLLSIYMVAAAAKSLQSCPTLCDPVDSSHQDPPSLGFSRQEHWSGLPFPSPMHESEKWKVLKIDFFFKAGNLVKCYAPHLLHNMERLKSLVFRKRKHVSDRKLSLRISLSACQSVTLYPWSQLSYLPVRGSPRSWLILTQKKYYWWRQRHCWFLKIKYRGFKIQLHILVCKLMR